MNTGNPSGPELTGEVMFYKQPEPLTLERHRLLGAKRIERPYAFLSGANIVPLTVNEFGAAAASFPIVFVGPEKSPVAVMGARPGENVFVNDEGMADPECYLPAFVRRYPFVFAKDEQNERMILCIDRAAPMIGENAETPLFIGDKPSEFTQGAIEFCTEFERVKNATEEFVKLFADLDMFEEKSVAVTPRAPDGKQGESQKIADYFAISEAKLMELPADKLVMMRDQGALGAAFAHMVSLSLWPKIIQRTVARAEATAQQRGSVPLS